LKEIDVKKTGRTKRRYCLIGLAVLVLAAGCAGFKILFHATETKAVKIPPKKVAVSSEDSKKPPAHTIIKIPHICQETAMPTGCELISAIMLLNHFGCDTTADEIIKRTPKSILLSEDGKVYGMSPNQAFIGDPHSPDGLGCYAPVMTAVVDSYFWDGGQKKAVNATGTDLETLAKTDIAQGSPVLIWATAGMKEPNPGKSWILADTGKNFQWVAGEHCLLMVGYDTQKYYFSDPLSSCQTVGYDKSLVQERYRALGKQAVTVRSVSDNSP
jgi:uncharacterized protein YvpB